MLSVGSWGQKVKCSGLKNGRGKDMHREHGGVLKEFGGEGRPGGRRAAREGRGLGNRVFFSRTGEMWVSVSQGLGPSRREEKLSFTDSGEAGSVCLGGASGGSADSNQIHFLPPSTMVIDVPNDGPGASQVPKVSFNSPMKELILLLVFELFEIYSN